MKNLIRVLLGVILSTLFTCGISGISYATTDENVSIEGSDSEGAVDTKIDIPPPPEPAKAAPPKLDKCSYETMLDTPYYEGDMYDNELGQPTLSYPMTPSRVVPPWAPGLPTYRYVKVQCPNQPHRYERWEIPAEKIAAEQNSKAQAVAKSITSRMPLPKPTPGMALLSMPSENRVGTIPAGTPIALVRGAHWYWTDPAT